MRLRSSSCRIVVVTIADALGWRLTLPSATRGARPASGASMLTRMAGEAVNSLTPDRSDRRRAGEGVPAAALARDGIRRPSPRWSSRRRRSSPRRASSPRSASRRCCARLGRPRAGALGWLVVLVVGCVGLHRRARLGAASKPGRHAVAAPAARGTPIARAASIGSSSARAPFDDRLREFYRGEPRTFVRASTWHFTGWLLGVVEVLRHGDADRPLGLLARRVRHRDAGAADPRGVHRRPRRPRDPGAGRRGLCTFLGMAEADAVDPVALEARREVVFDGVGLAYLAQHGGRRAVRAE